MLLKLASNSGSSDPPASVSPVAGTTGSATMPGEQGDLQSDFRTVQILTSLTCMDGQVFGLGMG
jgi:hypothetical protein